MKRALLLVALALSLSGAVPAIAAPAPPDSFTVMLSGAGEPWWEADYDRSLPSGAYWTDGDRVGYRCLYAFLMLGSKVMGRVTFTRVAEASSYAVVNDKFMEEASRYYNGKVNTDESLRQLNDCPPPNVNYEPFAGDERPTIRYETKKGAVLETRPYPNIVAGEGITFQVTEVTPKRVTVVAYFNTLPAIVIYYDSMARNVVMTSDLPAAA